MVHCPAAAQSFSFMPHCAQ